MSVEKKQDFYGREVADAILEACTVFGASQERLEIEVVETGSSGIFGLIRKKAHIRACLKTEGGGITEEEFDVDALFQSVGETEPQPKRVAEPSQSSTPASKNDQEKTRTPQADPAPEAPPQKKVAETQEQPQKQLDPDESVSPESLTIVKTEIETIVDLMGFPSVADVQASGHAVSVTLEGDYEEDLIGPNGKVLDSLQYLLRKIVSRKVPERLRISVDTGNYRQRRLDDLKIKASELAEQVKKDGKTQALPALNPSERREIHMVLQEDREIRSRSVGDGLFKKILIYKPGKGNRSGNRKQGRPRNGRKRNDSKQNKTDS